MAFLPYVKTTKDHHQIHHSHHHHQLRAAAVSKATRVHPNNAIILRTHASRENSYVIGMRRYIIMIITTTTDALYPATGRRRSEYFTLPHQQRAATAVHRPAIPFGIN